MQQTNLVRQEEQQQKKMEAYYRFQSKIYDSTRWAFLFGRKQLIAQLPALEPGATILEVGCGTGYNLVRLAKRYPSAQIYGLDTSAIMIEKSRSKIASFSNVTLLNEAFGIATPNRPPKVDLIIFSYSLSMINPQWKVLIDHAKEQLRPSGYIGVVDFEYSQYKWFRNHMANNHVRMEKHLLPYLQLQFRSIKNLNQAAYGGWWDYFLFVGKK